MSHSKYYCKYSPFCAMTFNQKSDYDRHNDRKTPCISTEQMEQFIASKTTNNDNISILKTIFNYCLDVLRSDSIIGDKALRVLAYLLDLKLLEPQLNDTINIDTYDGYNFNHIDDEQVESHKTKLLQIVRFSNLKNVEAINLPIYMKCLWDDILSVHPKTKNIFLKNKGFDIINHITFKKLISKLDEFDFSTIENDILGEAYEEIIKNVMVGKTLGQFFTPPNIKKMMVSLLDPQINADGTIETIFDPAMGTGGFLITCLKHIIKQSNIKSIDLDWEFIRSKGLGGREPEPDTYQLAVSNMLISSGYMFDVLEKGDSIRDPITNKYNIIIANPPFGIDGLEYLQLVSNLRNEYMPIKSNSAVPLFLQAIIYMLKIGGRCALVLPDGQELFSGNKTLVAVREFLMKTCDLKEVIYLPAGTFTHTDIKTCVFYFYKKREGSDVLKTNLKKSKDSSMFTFSKTHQTNKVKFYDYNTMNETKHLLIEVDIEEIAKKNYSLNYTNYLREEDEIYEDGVIVKTLGDICEFINGYAFKSECFEENNNDNVGVVQIKSIQNGYIGNSKITEFVPQQNKLAKYEIHRGDILIALSGATTGKLGIYMLDKISYINQRVAKIICNEIDPKYFYYWYIYCDIENKILNLAQGTAQPNISTTELAKLKIPVPSLKLQKEMIEYFDFIYERCNKTSLEKINELKQLNEYTFKMQNMLGNNQTKTLHEICEFLPKSNRQSSYGNKEGNYSFYTSSQKCTKYCNEYDYEDECIIIGTGGNANIKYNSKFSCSADNYVLKSKNESVITKYMYYYLFNNIQILENGFNGCGIKHISKDFIRDIKIQVQSLEVQKEIVTYCEKNDELIKQLENEIELNKERAKLFISRILSKSNNDLNNDSKKSVSNLIGNIKLLKNDFMNDDGNLIIDDTVFSSLTKQLNDDLHKVNQLLESSETINDDSDINVNNST